MMPQKKYLNRISLLSAAKTGGIIMGMIGLVAGIVSGVWVSFFIALVGYSLGQDISRPGFAIIIFLPILFAVVFSIAGGFFSLFLALLYNLTAAFFGGLEIETKEKNPIIDKKMMESHDENNYRKNAFRPEPDRRFARRRSKGGAF